MKIALVQTDPVWADPVANRARVRELVSPLEGVDLVVLPEMFSTGFVTEPVGIAESQDSGSLALLKEIASTKGCAVAGSIAIEIPSEKGSQYRNRFYFVHPDGKVEYYDKHHLFTYGGEHLHYTPGQERVVVEHCGVRILLQVCYDLRFPVFSRNRMVDGRPEYDLILYVASWPVRRVDAWDALLNARAIENLSYVVGVNRTGNDPSNSYCGHSRLIDPMGKTLASCKEGEENVTICELDTNLLELFRKSFPALLDADETVKDC